MKKTISLVFAICFSSILFAEDVTSSFDVKGMMCGKGCATKIKAILGDVDGVNTVNVNFKKGTMEVGYDNVKLDNEKIMSAIHNSTSYTCSVPPKKQESLMNRIFSWF